MYLSKSGWIYLPVLSSHYLILWFVLFSLTYHYEFAFGLDHSVTFIALFKMWLGSGYFSCTGKRKALKLNFANPPVKPATRFTLNTAGPPFQNPHMWVKHQRLQHHIRKFLFIMCFPTSLYIHLRFLQREAEDTQHRIVREVEDLPRAALGLHGRGSQRFGWDRPGGLRLCQ